MMHSAGAASSDGAPQVFADDAGVTSSSPDGLSAILQLTGAFAKVTRQKFKVEKSKAWCTAEQSQAELRKLSIGEDSLAVVRSSRVLGLKSLWAGTALTSLHGSACIRALKLQEESDGLLCHCMLRQISLLVWWAQSPCTPLLLVDSPGL